MHPEDRRKTERDQIRAAMQREASRCDALEDAFVNDPAFALFAIVRGWTLEQAQSEFQKRRTSAPSMVSA